MQSKPENLCGLIQRNDEDIIESLAAKERLLAKKYNLEEVLGIKSDEDTTAENKCEPSQSSVNEDSFINGTCTDIDYVEETLTTMEPVENTSETLTGLEGIENVTGGEDCLEDNKSTALGSVLGCSSLLSGSSQHFSQAFNLTSLC